MKSPKSYKASYTVEAAAVVSLIFLILGAFLMLVFFVHDRAVIQSTVCEAAAVGGNFMTQEERNAAVSEVCSAVSESRLLGSRGYSISADVGEESISASGTASFPVPGMFASYLGDGEMQIFCGWSSRKADPADVIRKIRGAELVLENLDSK